MGVSSSDGSVATLSCCLVLHFVGLLASSSTELKIITGTLSTVHWSCPCQNLRIWCGFWVGCGLLLLHIHFIFQFIMSFGCYVLFGVSSGLVRLQVVEKSMSSQCPVDVFSWRVFIQSEVQRFAKILEICSSHRWLNSRRRARATSGVACCHGFTVCTWPSSHSFWLQDGLFTCHLARSACDAAL